MLLAEGLSARRYYSKAFCRVTPAYRRYRTAALSPRVCDERFVCVERYREGISAALGAGGVPARRALRPASASVHVLGKVT